MTNYYIADTHFGHDNVRSYDKEDRFATKEERDNLIITNWNNTVGMEDNIYILGDFSWYNNLKTLDILRNLNGNKYLIRGNHDHKMLKNRDIQKEFIIIKDYMEINDSGKTIVLSHYPLVSFKNHLRGSYHFYGHVHNSQEYIFTLELKQQLEDFWGKEINSYNVGIMMNYINYCPRTLEEITGVSKM